MNLGPKSPIQWICREWVGKLGFNELDNNYNGSRSRWSKSGQVYLKKIVLDTIREDQFMYILLGIDYKYSVNGHNLFLSLISWSLFLRAYLLIYTTSPSSSLLSTWMVDCLGWSLSHQYPPEVFEGTCNAEKYCSDITSSLMRLES